MQKKSFQIYNKSTPCKKTSERILVTSKEKMPKKSFQIYNKSTRCKKKHQKESLSPERKRLQRSHSRSVLSRLQSPKNLGHTKSKESAHLAIKSSWEDSSVQRSWSRSPKNLGHTKSKESAYLAIKSSREDSSVKRSRHDLQNMLATQGLKNLLIWQLNLHRRIHQS